MCDSLRRRRIALVGKHTWAFIRIYKSSIKTYVGVLLGELRETEQTDIVTLQYFLWGFGRDRTRRQTSHCYCYWGLKVQGFAATSM